MATTFTYIKDGVDPRLNIRIATDAAGYDTPANAEAVARYWGISVHRIAYSPNEGFLDYDYSPPRLLARLERVTLDITFDTAAH